MLSDKRGQFAYFDAQLGHPDWRRATVLDFGGNRGNLLADAEGAIEPSHYWSLDVSREAVRAGARRFDDAHFVHYDRWHPRYNPRGRPAEPLPSLGTFDFIVAYSVFTMLAESEIVELATALHARLARGGTLAFTFIDPHYRSPWCGRTITNLEWRLMVGPARNQPIDPSAADAAARDCVYLIEQRWIEPAPRLAFETFITASRIRGLLPGCEILPPTARVRHHCCVLRQ